MFHSWPWGMWDLTSPQSWIEPAIPALEGEILTTAPPGKSYYINLYEASVTFHISGEYIWKDDVVDTGHSARVGFPELGGQAWLASVFPCFWLLSEL